MKFYSMMTIVAILFSVIANAQHVNFGIKGGLNLYKISNYENSKYDTKPGVHFGILGHIHLNHSIAVQPELVYSSQGAKYRAGGTNYRLNLGYINAPVMLQYMFANGFRLEAGPQLGFLINAKSVVNNKSVDVKSGYKSVDVGAGIGAGYFKQSIGLGAGLRYNIGLSNINESNSVKTTNQGFQLSVFYQFKHK